MVCNKINVVSNSAAYGMRLYGYQNYNSGTYGANGPMFIANNEVRIQCTSTAYGIYTYGSTSYSRFDVINNSIYINNTSTCYAFYWYPCSTSYPSKFINNLIHVNSTGTVYMIQFGSTSYWGTSYCTMDYNNYYREGSGTTTYYGSNSYQSLIAWQNSNAGQDANSTSITTSFTNVATDLVPASYSGLSCPRVAGVMRDIRGNVRGTTTYVGCYVPFALDAAICKTATTPSVVAANQNLPLSVVLRNAGLDTITSASIEWTYNNTPQLSIPWTGSLLSEADTTIALGTVLINSRENDVKVWVSNPNTSTDPNPTNDTTLFSIYGCDSLLYGTYTVGGASAKFATLTDAVAALMNCGVSGPTTFLINSGTYNESINMVGAIPGASVSNTVTFISAAEHADSVQIATSGTTWLLSNISYVYFRNITIGSQSNIGEKAVVLDGSCSDIEFYQCNLYADTSTTNSSNACVYYNNTNGSTNYLKNVNFIKNHMDGGYYNMYFYYPAGSNSNMGTMSVTIDSNIMSNAYCYALYSYYYARYPSISYNTITSRNSSPTTSNWYGIYLYYYHNVDALVGNKIWSTNTSISSPRGIYIYYYYNYTEYSGNGSGLLANNEVVLYASSSSSYGIHLYYPASNVNVVHNSVYIYGTGSPSAFYTYNSTTSTSYKPVIKNNNFVTEAGSSAYPIYYNSGYYSSSYFDVDYNNYYSSGSNVGYAGSAQTSIEGLRASTEQDIYSVSKSQFYYDYPNSAKVYGYDLACPQLSLVTTDIENVTRTSPTVMGAYQFIPYVDYDIQPYALVSPSTVVTTGVKEAISIELMNVGSTTITSATIDWSFNGVARSPVNWTGNLASGSSVTVTLDSILPTAGINSLEIITSAPNGQTDTMQFNDTLRVNIFACDSMLSGVYTVGTSGQFSTLDNALNILQKCGVKDAVTLLLETGTYPPATFLGAIPGTSTTNTITITSATGNASDVTIGNSTTTEATALTIDNYSNLILKDITIGTNSTYTGIAVELKGMCENVLFYGCNIQTYRTGTSSTYIGVRYNNSSGATSYLKDVRFIKNTIDGGYYNMYFNYPAGSTTNMSTNGMSVTVDSNILSNSYCYAFYSSWHARYPSISYNTITSRTSGSVTSNWYGIYLYYYQNVEEIVGNKIQSTYTSITNPRGIYIDSYYNYTSYSGSGSGLIANNEIILRTTSSYYGIYLYNPMSNVNVLHNSIYMYGTGNAQAMYLYNGSSSYQPVIKNNNFVTVAGSSAYPIYYNGSYSTSYYTVDYNNYYSSGSNVGYAGGARTTIAALRTATGQDANSINTNPGYAATPTDLIPTNWISCPVLAEVPKDIVGNLRLGITRMGCYTYVYSLDAGLSQFVDIQEKVSVGSIPIKVRLTNFGSNTLTSVSLQCSVNGVTQPVVNLTGLSLAKHQDTVITVGSFTAVHGTTYHLKAWTFNPNSSSDLNVLNDTINFTVVGCSQFLNGVYTVGAGKDFSTLNDVATILHSCGVTGPVTLLLDPGNYASINITETFYGTSPTNTVTLASATGDSTDVVFSSTSTVITLQNAAHLILHKVTLAGNMGMLLQEGCQNIEISNCVISLPNASNSNYRGVSFNGTSCISNIRILNNRIGGGHYGVYFYGLSSSDRNNDIVVDNNYMNTYAYGIYGYYTNFVTIDSNILTQHSSSTSNYYGMNLSYGNCKSISYNKIKAHSAAGGVYSGTSFGAVSSAKRLSITNNEIILTVTNDSRGIYFGSGQQYTDFYHNSILMRGTMEARGCLYLLNTATSVNIKNNNFVNLSGTTSSTTTYAFYTSVQSYLNNFTMDYNNYYTQGTNIAYAGNAVYDLPAWQFFSGKDANSVSEMPVFTSPNYDNLRTDGFSLHCPVLPDVPKDIVNKSRYLFTNMGCYHDFTPMQADVKMLEITSPINGVAVGDLASLGVKIMNLGEQTLDSVRFYWSINNSPIDSVDYNCNIPHGAKSEVVDLATFIPLSGVNTLLVYTALPNGHADGYPSNDTLRLSVYACDSMLNGIYTIGTGGDFPDEIQAMGALLSCGVNGPTEFRFMAGSYGELKFKNIPGASMANMVTFTSLSGNAGGVTFAAIEKVALTLHNVSHLIFKNVSFDATLGRHAVEFIGGCNNILLYECNITADPQTTQTYAGIYRGGSSGSSTGVLNDIRIIKNNIKGGYYNIYWYYGGGSSSNMGSGCCIDSNVCTDAHYYGINLHYSYTNFNSVSYNKVICRSANANNYFYGIRFYYYNNVREAVGNKVYVRNTAVNYAYPMYIYYYNNHTNNPFGPMLIANNEIISEAGNYSYGGIYVYMYSPANVINNSIYSSASSTAYGLYLYTSSTTYPIVAKNNNVHVANASTCYPLYISSTTYANPTYTTLDYNNYYSTTNVGYVGGARTTLAQLQSATGQDVNSVSELPSYINLSKSLELDDYSDFLCQRFSNVLTNINGESRTLVTTMGAYSVYVYDGNNMAVTSIIEPINTDEVSCYQDFASIKVAVANSGNLPINFAVTPMILHVDVQGAVNFQADTTISVGVLKATRKDTVKITDLLPVSLNGSYNITAWLELPIDAFSGDDTVQSVYIIDKISIPYNINFDTMPSGLVFKQLAGSSHWTVESGDGVNPIISPSHGSGRLQFLSESGRGSMARVTLQPFNLKGSASPQMKFWYAHDNGNPMSRDYTEVKISIDGGTTYSTLLNLQRYNAAYATPTFVRYEIDLSPYTAYSCVILAFEAGSYGGGNQNIDSIAIISKQDISLELDVTEQSEFVACELDNKAINVKITNLTTQVFDFERDSSQITVEVSGVVDTLFTIPLTSGSIEGDTVVYYNITNTFDFSTNGTYDILAYLSSADDNTFNDTARQTRIVQVDAELITVNPIASKDEGDLVYPTVHITNKGNMPINNIPLVITINNVQVLTENIDTLLNPGDSIIYTFENPYTVPYASQQQPYYQMKISIDLDCDGNNNNNSSSKYYNVNIEGPIDLSIVQILYPLADSCLSGYTKVYPSIEVFNSGTAYAQGAKLYVLVDSAGFQAQSFVETLDDVPAQTSITFNCSKYYVVPNFKDTYTVTFSIELEKDVNQGNNSKSIELCAEETVSVPTMTALSWSLGQNIPNPAAANVSIPYTLPEEGKVHFKVMSINGQVLYQESIDAVQGVQYLDFNADNLAAGIYYYSMEYKGQRIVKKMTIQK
ncbi:MAG TPA: hypothetical protein PLP76_05900 [Bacteroidales bacterium]|nr:hypothetical protein [Bacteroidales bacterium]